MCTVDVISADEVHCSLSSFEIQSQLAHSVVLHNLGKVTHWGRRHRFHNAFAGLQHRPAIGIYNTSHAYIFDTLNIFQIHIAAKVKLEQKNCLVE